VGEGKAISEFKREFAGRLQVKDLGPVKKILSMQVTQMADSIVIEQQSYVQNLLKECKMTHCRPRVTPLDVGDVPQNDEAFEDVTFYRKIIGSLLCITNNNRCDIA